MGETNPSDLKYFPTVCLVCELNPFSLKIVQLLEKNFCKPLVLSEETEGWKRAVFERGLKETVIQKNDVPLAQNTNLNYLIYLDSPRKDTTKSTDQQEASNASIKIAKKNSCKAIFIYDYFQEEVDYKDVLSLKNKILEDKDLYAGLIYVGDTLFVNEDASDQKEKIFSNFLTVDLKKSMVFLPNRENLFLLGLDDVALTVIRNLFSLKAYGKSLAILSSPTTRSYFEKTILENNKDLQILHRDNLEVEVKVDEKINLPLGVDKEMKKIQTLFTENLSSKSLGKDIQKKDKLTANWLLSLRRSSALKVGDDVKKKKKAYRVVGYKIAVGLLIALFLIPLTLLITSFVLLGVGKFFFLRLDPSLTVGFFQSSKSFSAVTQEYSFYTSRIPLVRTFFLEIGESAKLLDKANAIGMRGLSASNNLISLTSLFSRNERIDKDRLNYLYLDLDDLSNQIGFFEAELNTRRLGVLVTSMVVLGNLELEKLKENITNAKKLAELLPWFLGEDKPVTYLVLFQDNSLLRPTGGVINKFSLITFSGGEIIDSETHDSNYIDKKLQGEVESPQPIRKYVNEKIWFFKDVNWDPDFPTSASKAEWFLDKSIDKSVDGVFALNVDFLREVFEEKNDFLKNTKSRDKKNALTETSDQEIVERFFNDVELLNYNDGVKYLLLLVQGLENKDVQIFLNDNRASRILNEISWDGSFSHKDCQNNCYSDFVSINEYGIEGVKAQDIKRKASLTISLEEKLIKRKMVYFLENPTESVYKGYLRMFAPGDTGFGVINETQKNNKLEVTPNLQGVRGYKEAGVFFEVLPGDTTILNFSWEGGSNYTFDNDGFYELTWKKQSGMEPFAINIKLEKNRNIKLEATPAFSLTAEDYLGYNTDLSRDYFSRIFWRKDLNE